MTNEDFKKMHNVRTASCFIWGKMRTTTQEKTLQIALRNCLKEAGGIGQYRCDFGEGGVHAIYIYFLQKVSG